MFNSGQFTSGLMRKITLLADEFAETMKITIGEVHAPRKIKEHISVGTAKKKDNAISIDVSIDISREGAPMASAYEWGSGEHATRGGAGKYEIKPREKDALAFLWPGHDPPWQSKKFLGMGREGKFLFHYVEHPGVAPRPFIAPSIRKILPKMKQELGKTIKAELLIGVKKVTVISA